MQLQYQEFSRLLESEDKEKCLEFATTRLRNGDIGVVALYEEVLAPSLNSIECKPEDSDRCVWREHVKSGIVRTIIENCYPYVVRERDSKYGGRIGKRVIVACPSDELHELGARMVTDFFTLAGYDATFVGANTPHLNIVSSVSESKADYVAISVTNFYNLVAAEKAIVRLRGAGFTDVKVIVGGRAFMRNPEAPKHVGADMVLQTFEDIRGLRGGER